MNLIDGITPEGRECWRPVFSPNDRFLAFIAKSDGQFDLFLYDLETGSERRLSNTPFDEWDPQFGLDGSQIVYAAHSNGNWDLFLQDIESGRTARLTVTKGDEWDPTFIDDHTIAFAGRFGSMEAIFERQLLDKTSSVRLRD